MSHSHTLIQPLFLQVLSIYNSHTLMNKSGGTWGSASWPRILGHVDWRSQRTDPQTLQLVDDSLSHSHLIIGFMSSLRGGSGLFNCSLTQIATWVYNALVNHYENVMVPELLTKCFEFEFFLGLSHFYLSLYYSSVHMFYHRSLRFMFESRDLLSMMYSPSASEFCYLYF